MYSKLFLFDFNIFLDLLARWPVSILVNFPGQHLASQDEVCVLAFTVSGESQEFIVASVFGHELDLVNIEHVRHPCLPDCQDLPDDSLFKGFRWWVKGFDHRAAVFAKNQSQG